MLVDRAAAHLEQPTIERVRSLSWLAPAIAASRRGQGPPHPLVGHVDGLSSGEGVEPAAQHLLPHAFNRSKLVCDCYPERSIRVSPRQADRGPILCGLCDSEFHPQDDGAR